MNVFFSKSFFLPFFPIWTTNSSCNLIEASMGKKGKKKLFEKKRSYSMSKKPEKTIYCNFTVIFFYSKNILPKKTLMVVCQDCKSTVKISYCRYFLQQIHCKSLQPYFIMTVSSKNCVLSRPWEVKTVVKNHWKA